MTGRLDPAALSALPPDVRRQLAIIATLARFLQGIGRIPDAELRTFSQYTDCLDPLRNGQVDVLTTDNVILAGYVAAAGFDVYIADFGTPSREDRFADLQYYVDGLVRRCVRVPGTAE